MTDTPCPCGSGDGYADCCALLHGGIAAPSAQALMRARYSAYVLGLSDFLRNSWHAGTRPASLQLEQPSPWQQLVILDAHDDGETGQVTFEATWHSDGEWGVLHETSRFLREQGQWFYHSGDTHERRLKPERNQPCPCGSGRKFKKCCGR